MSSSVSLSIPSLSLYWTNLVSARDDFHSSSFPSLSETSVGLFHLWTGQITLLKLPRSCSQRGRFSVSSTLGGRETTTSLREVEAGWLWDFQGLLPLRELQSSRLSMGFQNLIHPLTSWFLGSLPMPFPALPAWRPVPIPSSQSGSSPAALHNGLFGLSSLGACARLPYMWVCPDFMPLT